MTTITIDTSDLEPGIIILTATDGDKRVTVRLDLIGAQRVMVMLANASVQAFAETAMVALQQELQSRDTAGPETAT